MEEKVRLKSQDGGSNEDDAFISPIQKAKIVFLPKVSSLHVVIKRRVTRRSFSENMSIARRRVIGLQNAVLRSQMKRMVP